VNLTAEDLPGVFDVYLARGASMAHRYSSDTVIVVCGTICVLASLMAFLMLAMLKIPLEGAAVSWMLYLTFTAGVALASVGIGMTQGASPRVLGSMALFITGTLLAVLTFIQPTNALLAVVGGILAIGGVWGLFSKRP
jgi:hypothetical protein